VEYVALTIMYKTQLWRIIQVTTGSSIRVKWEKTCIEKLLLAHCKNFSNHY